MVLCLIFKNEFKGIILFCELCILNCVILLIFCWYCVLVCMFIWYVLLNKLKLLIYNEFRYVCIVVNKVFMFIFWFIVFLWFMFILSWGIVMVKLVNDLVKVGCVYVLLIIFWVICFSFWKLRLFLFLICSLKLLIVFSFIIGGGGNIVM